MGAPHEDGRTFSGKLSGTATRMKNTSKMAMAVASATTRFSLYASIMYAPSAGLITMLAANVADTCNKSRKANHFKTVQFVPGREIGISVTGSLETWPSPHTALTL